MSSNSNPLHPAKGLLASPENIFSVTSPRLQHSKISEKRYAPVSTNNENRDTSSNPFHPHPKRKKSTHNRKESLCIPLISDEKPAIYHKKNISDVDNVMLGSITNDSLYSVNKTAVSGKKSNSFPINFPLDVLVFCAGFKASKIL